MPTDLNRLLASIGKSTFIRYFDQFQDETISNQEMVERLPASYTLKSRWSRTTKARRIFRERLEDEALDIIINSDHVDPETWERARQLLSSDGHRES